jgi:predicted transcriptional regulator
VKTAISLPDELFERAEKIARRMKKSRSEVYREALAEYVARHEPEAVTATMDAVLDAVGEEPDGFVARATKRTLARSEW